MSSIPTNQFILEEYVRNKIRSLHCADRTARLTVGVEHEIFLVDRSGLPADLDLSQEFLARLSQTPNWRVFSKKPGKSYGADLLISVSTEGKTRGFTAVKYEHPASLMEIAFGYHSTMHELKENIFSTWEAIENAANSANCRLLSVPIFRLAGEATKGADSLSQVYRELSLSRRACFNRRNEPVDETIVDFPTFTAATQIHVGGLRWWDPNSIINVLYKTESAVQAIPYLLACNTNESAKSLCRERWGLYGGVFKGTKLLGFPDLPEWTFQAWISALLESPLVEAGADLNESGSLIDRNISVGDLDLLFPRIRDLEIMKPKLTGTIEFRADPAMPGPEEILTLAGIRLGQCLLAEQLIKKNVLHGIFNDLLSRSFTECRKEWWRNVGDLEISSVNSDAAIEVIMTYLEERDVFVHRLLKQRIA